MPEKKLTEKEKFQQEKRFLRNVIVGAARTITLAMHHVEHALEIDCLYAFISAYITNNPNMLYFSPKYRLDNKNKALLLFLQCLDENNKDISEVQKELNEILTKINKERQ